MKLIFCITNHINSFHLYETYFYITNHINRSRIARHSRVRPQNMPYADLSISKYFIQYKMLLELTKIKLACLAHRSLLSQQAVSTSWHSLEEVAGYGRQLATESWVP